MNMHINKLILTLSLAGVVSIASAQTAPDKTKPQEPSKKLPEKASSSDKPAVLGFGSGTGMGAGGASGSMSGTGSGSGSAGTMSGGGSGYGYGSNSPIPVDGTTYSGPTSPIGTQPSVGRP